MKTVILITVLSITSLGVAHADAGTNMFAGGSAFWYANTMALPTLLNNTNNTAPAPNYYSYDDNDYNSNGVGNFQDYSSADAENEDCSCEDE